MQEPTLVVMAAGMGSRFGGLKQITPVDDVGHPILDFSLYDAHRAGFTRVVFIIKHAIAEDFRAAVGARMERLFHVDYVYQELDRLPPGVALPAGRTKPWGTGHAVACCRGVVDGPLAVINADDFYGPGAFRAIYAFLSAPRPDSEHAMVGYRLCNTVTEHGSVSRGICTANGGFLTGVTEHTRIEKRGAAAVSIAADGTETPLTGAETVSMNFWGFSARMLDVLYARFPAFLAERLPVDGLKCEYFLPTVVSDLIWEGSDSVRVLPCNEVWHGVTYQEDLQSVRTAIAEMKASGVYPAALWD